jgi:hypothetical protein
MSSRGRWSAAVGMALALGLFVPVGLAGPAGAAQTTFTDTCDEVYGERAIGDLDKTTDPVAGSAVSSGDTVSVLLQWPNKMVAGNRTHRVLECLSVDGGAPRQWAERQFTTDQGAVTFEAVVPSGLSAKSTICSQSFLKTEGAFGPVTRWSEKTCFPLDPSGAIHAFSRIPSPPSQSKPEPENRSTPTTRGPLFSSPPSQSPSSRTPSPPSGTGSGDYKPPWPPWEKTPRVAASPPVTTPTTSKAASPSTPRKAQGTEVAAPASQGATRAPSQTLPRTGAGVVVLMAIAGVALFSGRTLRKTANHIEDNLPVEAVPVDDDQEPTLVLGRRW